MKLFITAIFFAGALAQTASPTLPSCAENCALSAIGGSGCAITNATCVCLAPAYTSAYESCVGASCNPSEATAAASYGSSYCASNGVTIPAASNGSMSSTVVLTSSGMTMTTTESGSSSMATQSESQSSGSQSTGASMSSSASASASSSSSAGVAGRLYWSDTMLGIVGIIAGFI